MAGYRTLEMGRLDEGPLEGKLSSSFSSVVLDMCTTDLGQHLWEERDMKKKHTVSHVLCENEVRHTNTHVKKQKKQIDLLLFTYLTSICVM